MNTLIKKLTAYTPLSDLFSLYHHTEQAVFLDSSLHNELGQYSIIGIHPYLTLSQKEGICYRNHTAVSISFEEMLSSYLKENKEENPFSFPFLSGAIGYFTYDYGRHFENVISRFSLDPQIPEALFTFYDNLIIEDHSCKTLYLTARGALKDAAASLSEIEFQVSSYSQANEQAILKHTLQADFSANFTKAGYQNAIAQMMDYIIEGDIYIANMTQQLRVKSKKDPYQVFRYLRQHNPSPFGCYLNYGDFQVICASPERFLRLKEGHVETRPIKGTRKRGSTPFEDEILKKELQESLKDKSELLMIVDLLRNDLNRVCIPGSVQVTQHFSVETYATVFHLVSTIVGELRPECNIMDLIAATFPGGSITGAPKIRAMEIIDELEQSSRGLYTGSIGYLGFDGSCDLNIVIRTALHQNHTYYLGVGGGITCESDTEFEYEETLQKAKAVLEAMYDNKNFIR